MNCPVCGSTLNERQTAKGVTFLLCSRWPTCRVSGTPELMERFPVPPQRKDDPVHVGSFITKLAQLRIHQSKLRGKTAEERERIRQAALEALK